MPRLASVRVFASLHSLQSGWMLVASSVPPSANDLIWSLMVAIAVLHRRQKGSSLNNSRRSRWSLRPLIRVELWSWYGPVHPWAVEGACAGHRPLVTRSGHPG